MPYYRELAGSRIFRCAECGRRKYVKYVPTSNLCRECAAKNRRKIDNIAVQLGNNIVITKIVERKFIKRAKKEIPLSRKEMIGDQISRWGPILFWITSYFVARAFFVEWTGPFWLLFLGWGFSGTFGSIYMVDLVLAKPRKERAERIRLKIVELAEDRKRKIEEAEQFYSSPEWNMLRRQVIKQKGSVCAECGRRIKQTGDITVDHIKPRSKYPDLALKIENLRVLCRSCNSRKSDREFELDTFSIPH
ncbi:MAG: HNH endonuclease signature motif containing protein [Chloroflexi bacterium]|nr:HNH endonuclease signature motif containing protein [Chloroflexota bacterium]